jgi:hypothetical protein
MSSLRRILIGLAVLAALGAAAGWVYRQRVASTPASIPFGAREWAGYLGGEWYDD